MNGPGRTTKANGTETEVRKTKPQKMKKAWLIFGCAGAVIFSSCEDEYRKGAQTRTTVGDVPATTPPNHRVTSTALYRQQSERAASQMAADLQLSPDIRSRVQQVYYTRAVRLGELQARNNTFVSNRRAELNNNVGVGSNAATNSATGARVGTPNPSQNEDLQTLNQETADALREILTPDQFARYEANRARYDLAP